MKNDKLQTAPGDEATAGQEQEQAAASIAPGDFGNDPVYKLGSVVSIDESGIATLTGDVRVCVPAVCIGDTVLKQGFKFFKREEN